MRATATAAALVLAAGIGASACSGDGDGDDAASSAVGAAAGQAAAQRAAADEQAAAGTAASTTPTTAAPSGGGSSTTASALPELPPPSIPAEASPPTTGPDTVTDPSPNTGWPRTGEIIVDLEPGGYLDFPVQLQQGQHVEMITWADDGVLHEARVYAPDATSLVEWRGGEPGTYTGVYWDADDPEPLPVTGPYVIRVRHLGGAHNPFVFAIYSE